MVNAQFQEISITPPHPKRVNGNSKGRGLAKEKVLQEKYGTKLEYPEGCGECKPKQPSVGGGGMCGYFLEPHNGFNLESQVYSWWAF